MKTLTVAKKYQQPTEKLLLKIAMMANETADLIDLSLGDPDLITSEKIIDAAFRDAKAGHTKYTAADGSKAFIQAVIDYYKKQYGLTFEPKQVRATVGGLHGMYLALRAILDPGDEVIIHEPYFSPYKDQVLLAGGTPKFVPTYELNGFQLDVEDLKACLTNKTKAIIINSPNNPTGAVFSKETLEKIAEVAIEEGLYILSDEVYEAFSFFEDFIPMATLAPDHTITFGSFSKTFAMTGWRIGYMIASTEVNQVARQLNENITYSAPTLSQQAGIYALEHKDELLFEVANVFKERLEYVALRVAKIPFLALAPIKGTMYAFINIKQTGLGSIAFVEKILKEAKVLLIPGKAFGETTGDDYVRLAATQDIALLKEAFDRIETLTF